MEGLRVENLRSLSDTGYIGIRPLTVLVGRNSSGKSTFLRTLPLLRQSVETRTTGPVLWYGNYVDFGSFSEALRTDADERRIALGFRFRISRTEALRYARYYWYPSGQSKFLEDLEFSVSLDLCEEPDSGATRASAVEIHLFGQRIRIEYGPRNKVDSFFVNALNVLALGSPYSTAPTINFIPVIHPRSESNQRELVLGMPHNRKIAENFVNSLRWYFHGNTNVERIRALLSDLGIGNDEQMLADLKRVRLGGNYWRQRVTRWSVDTPVFTEVRDLVLASWTPVLLSIVDSYISEFADGVSYIAPLRATAERYYRSQNLAVDEVDFQGKNLPMFLQSLSQREMNSFQRWMEAHFGLTMSTTVAGGHLSLRVTETKSGSNYNLADVGFGLSQILPVIAQLWAITGRDPRTRAIRSAPITLAIEQPELHLHPSLQARVADVLIDAVAAAEQAGVKLRIVIETHSETIINRIGQRIDRSDLLAGSVEVVLFEKEESTATKVRFSEFDNEGYLVNWPLGFFQPEIGR